MKKPKPKTPELIAFITLCLMLSFAAFGIYQAEKEKDVLIKEVISSKIQNDSLKTQNDSLKTKIKELKTFERYGISIGDTTLQVVTKLNIQGEPYKCLHIKRINKGRNDFYFVLNEKTAVDLILMKY